MRLSVISMISAAVLALCYGSFIALTTSGSRNYLMWFAAAALCGGAAVALSTSWWTDLPRWIRMLIGISGAGMAALILASSLWIYAQGHTRNVDQPLSYLVVLGSYVEPDGQPSTSLRQRLDQACFVASQHPEAYIVVSGGQGENERIPEAQAMRHYLLEQGITDNRIIVEATSTTTQENLRNSSVCIAQHASQQTSITRHAVALITNDFHVARALAAAHSQAWYQEHAQLYGIGAPSTPVYLPHNCIRESLALFLYLATGKARL